MLTMEQAVKIGRKLEPHFDDVLLIGTGEFPVIVARGHTGDIPFHRHGSCKHESRRRTGRIRAAIRKDRGETYLCHPQHKNHPVHQFDWTIQCMDCDALIDYEFIRPV